MNVNFVPELYRAYTNQGDKNWSATRVHFFAFEQLSKSHSNYPLQQILTSFSCKFLRQRPNLDKKIKTDTWCAMWRSGYKIGFVLAGLETAHHNCLWLHDVHFCFCRQRSTSQTLCQHDCKLLWYICGFWRDVVLGNHPFFTFHCPWPGIGRPCFYIPCQFLISGFSLWHRFRDSTYLRLILRTLSTRLNCHRLKAL